jgi:hypothetical protein
MKSDVLDGETVDDLIQCLRTAAGEINHSVFLLEQKLTQADLDEYKRLAGKVIIAIYSGLADPILEHFPDKKTLLYGDPA